MTLENSHLVVCGTVNLRTRYQQGFWNADFWTLASRGSGDHVTGFDRLDMRVLSGYPLRTPFSLSPQSYLCGHLGGEFHGFFQGLHFLYDFQQPLKPSLIASYS